MYIGKDVCQEYIGEDDLRGREGRKSIFSLMRAGGARRQFKVERECVGESQMDRTRRVIWFKFIGLWLGMDFYDVLIYTREAAGECLEFYCALGAKVNRAACY